MLARLKAPSFKHGGPRDLLPLRTDANNDPGHAKGS